MLVTTKASMLVQELRPICQASKSHKSIRKVNIRTWNHLLLSFLLYQKLFSSKSNHKKKNSHCFTGVYSRKNICLQTPSVHRDFTSESPVWELYRWSLFNPYFIFLFVCLFLHHTQQPLGMRIALLSEIVPGRFKETIWNTRDQNRVSHVQDNCPTTVLLLRPIFSFFYAIFEKKSQPGVVGERWWQVWNDCRDWGTQ